MMWKLTLFLVVSLVVQCHLVSSLQLDSDVFRHKSLFDVLLDIYKEFPAELSELLNQFKTQLNIDNWPGSSKPPTPNITRCEACTFIIAFLKAAIVTPGYDAVEGAIIDLCHSVISLLNSRLPGTDIRADPLCNGTVKLQGPHIYQVLKPIQVPPPQVTAEEFCQYLNGCFPPGTSIHLESVETVPANPPARHGSQVKDRRGNATPNSKTGRDGRSGTIKVVQLTDVHVEPNYAVGSATDCGLPVCCLSKWTGVGTAGMAGDYHCNIPQRTIDVFLSKVKELEPDVVLFSGDVPPHTVWEETADSQFQCTALLIESLTRNLSGYVVYPNIGNHEMYPTNLFAVNKLNTTAPILVKIAAAWAPVANFSRAQNDTVKVGGYYNATLRSGLRLLSYNTNYMYTFNWYNVLTNRVTPPANNEITKMKNAMTDTLRTARTQGAKVIMMGHHPPGGGDFIVKESRWLEKLVFDYSDVIVLQVSGHTHKDEFRLFYNSTGYPHSMVYVSPSMTTEGTKNPSMRLYYLDATTYEVIDYDHYYMNLRPTTAWSDPKFDFASLVTHLYSAKKEYEHYDLSPTTWHEFVQGFEYDADSLKKHRSHSDANAKSDFSYRCPETCRIQYSCGLQHTSYDKYVACADTPRRQLNITWDENSTAPAWPSPPGLTLPPRGTQGLLPTPSPSGAGIATMFGGFRVVFVWYLVVCLVTYFE